jgi:hypothetical protein
MLKQATCAQSLVVSGKQSETFSFGMQSTRIHCLPSSSYLRRDAEAIPADKVGIAGAQAYARIKIATRCPISDNHQTPMQQLQHAQPSCSWEPESLL